MKFIQKLAFFTLFAILNIFFLSLIETMPIASAKLTTFMYAKVESSGVNLYKTSNAINENAYFEIPSSYFVLLLSNYNSLFYKAQYQDIVGFILKSQVMPVNETPEMPYLTNTTFYVFTTDGTTVMDSPTSKGKALTTVEKYEEISYYGTILGEEKTMGRGNSWIFGKTKQGVMGYFYAGLCEMNSSIVPNNEIVTKATNPFSENDNDYLYSLVDLTPSVKIALLLLVLLPAIFLLFLAFKPTFTGHLPFKRKKQSIKDAQPAKRQTRTAIKRIESYPDDNF